MRFSMRFLSATVFLIALSLPVGLHAQGSQVGAAGFLTFYKGRVEGRKSLCMEITAVKPATEEMGTHSLRYAVHVYSEGSSKDSYLPKKALNQINVDRQALWNASHGLADYAEGTSRIDVGKHTFSVAVTTRSLVTIEFAMQSNPKTGEILASVNPCDIVEQMLLLVPDISGLVAWPFAWPAHYPINADPYPFGYSMMDLRRSE